MPNYARITERLYVGSYPESLQECDAFLHDAIVNVSDSPCWQFEQFQPRMTSPALHWIPVMEVAHWTHAQFYAIKRILDHHLLDEQGNINDIGGRVVVHCHAGAYRSMLMTYAWLLSIGQEGLYPEAAGSWVHFVDSVKCPERIVDFMLLMNSKPEWTCEALLRDLSIATYRRTVAHECGALRTELFGKTMSCIEIWRPITSSFVQSLTGDTKFSIIRPKFSANRPYGEEAELDMSDEMSCCRLQISDVSVDPKRGFPFIRVHFTNGRATQDYHHLSSIYTAIQ